ncbi:MAG: TRAP transporter substrate-binding protein DctP [Deltaproteobacteria bacterium]|nr:TRAP transporter substrate-binding protein DctP [Deltaproteobacteria bacterium]
MIRKVLVGVSAAAALLALSAGSAQAQTKLKIGTPAAPESPWGQVFKTWKKAVEAKTNNAVSFDFFFNSTQGTESTMVDKMKAGQLDGAALTSVGLGKIDKRLLAIQVPGAVRSWKAVDAVRAAIGPEYDKFLTDKKFVPIAYADVGQAHFLSKGFAVHQPDDLKGKSPWVYSEDPILKTVYAKIGGVNPFPAELMSVLPNIDNGKINCLSIGALAAEMLQWNSKFDNAVDQVNAILVGGLVMSTDSLDKLPGDQKAAVLDTGKSMVTAATGLKNRIRNEDAAAWNRFKSRTGVTIYAPTADDIAKWEVVFKASRDALKAGTFDPGLVSKIESVGAANK